MRQSAREVDRPGLRSSVRQSAKEVYARFASVRQSVKEVEQYDRLFRQCVNPPKRAKVRFYDPLRDNSGNSDLLISMFPFR